MTDRYNYLKSSLPQSATDLSPYTNLQWDSINDTNSGIYTNNGMSQVQFDLSSIFNSQDATNCADHYIAIPITMVAALSSAANAGADITAPAGGHSLLSLKSGFHNLIHQCDIIIGGQTVEQAVPFQNIISHFRLLSELTDADLKVMGPTLGWSDSVDNHVSMIWNGTATDKNGNGMTNNKPFGNNATAASDVSQSMNVAQGANTVNRAITKRLSRYADVSGNTTTNKFEGILGLTQLQAEFKPYYTKSGNYMIWYDVAVVKLAHIFDSMAQIGIVNRLDATMRLYINTGSLSITLANPNSTTLTYAGTVTTSTFSNTCPFTINYLPDTSANGGLTTGCTKLAAGCFIGKAPITNAEGINLGSSNAAHPILACRYYYNKITMSPSLAKKYQEENLAKKVVFKSALFNQYSNVSRSFSSLVQSGVRNPIGVLIVPLLNPTNNHASAGYSQYGSPFDTCPATFAPISLTNLQVKVGGTNVLNTAVNYCYENFIEQVSLFESVSGNDSGLSVGLFSQSWWENNRLYFVDCSRGQLADKMDLKQVQVSFNVNTVSTVAVDVLIFTYYLDGMTINVSNGIVDRNDI